jgi:peptide/nickel transport system substrate-binding protein
MLTDRRWLSILVFLAAAGVCTLACQRRQAGESVHAVMRIGVGVPAQPNTRTGLGNVIDAITTETWLTMRPDGKLSERLVTGWAWDAPRTTLTLKLRPDVFFHDGSQLTADRAAAAIRQSVNDRGAFSFSSIESVDVNGPASIALHLASPNAFVLPDLALTSARLASRPEVGTGPFKVDSSSEQQVVLSAFPSYYRGQPGLQTIEVSQYPTQRNAWAALMRGQIDMLYDVSRDAADFVESETSVATYSFRRSYYIPLVFNVRNSALQNIEVRRAINEAIDKEALVRDGMSGRGRAADGPILPEHWAYSAPRDPFVYDPPAAKARLDRAGFRTRKTNGATPVRFSFTCLVFADDNRFERLALLVQKQLADVGIDMKLVPLPQRQLVPRLAKGDFDAFLFEMAGRSLSWVYEFWHSKGAMINSGYHAADATLESIKLATTDDEIRTGIARLTQLMHDDPPAVFIAWQTTSRAVSTRFDVGAEPNRDILANLWQWRPAKAE